MDGLTDGSKLVALVSRVSWYSDMEESTVVGGEEVDISLPGIENGEDAITARAKHIIRMNRKNPFRACTVPSNLDSDAEETNNEQLFELLLR